MIEDMLKLTVDVVFPKSSIRKKKTAKANTNSPTKTSSKFTDENKALATPERPTNSKLTIVDEEDGNRAVNESIVSVEMQTSQI